MTEKTRSDVNSEMKCGIGICYPAWLQRFRSIACFTAVFGVSTCFTSSLIFYVSSQITALEKQFGFSSFQSGVLLSCNEVGFLMICLIVSFFARKVHIPRSLALSTVFSGVCGIFSSLAYFMSPKDQLYTNENKDNMNQSETFQMTSQRFQMCDIAYSNRTQTSSRGLENCFDQLSGLNGLSAESTTIAFAIIAIGMFIGGFAKSPREPFSTTYIDDNIPKTQTALHVGILGSVGILGPALGFGLGGLFSKIYVTLEGVDITPEDQRWIGAWWLGFVVFGCLSILSAIPIILFPRQFNSKSRIPENEKEKKEPKLQFSMKEFLDSVLRLLKNPIYVLVAVTNCIDLFTVSGWVAFEPKYMETQFNLPAWEANIYVGVLAVIPAGIGCLLGGIITSKYKLSPLSCVKFMITGGIFCIIVTLLSIFIGCSNPPIVGLPNESDKFPYLSVQSPENQSSMCYSTCGCNYYDFFPVCGENDVIYFSPCHAGCHHFQNQKFTGCTCLSGDQFPNGTADTGLCESDCNMLLPYIVLNFVFGILVTSYTLPIIIIFIRSVLDEDKAMAMGLMLFLTTLLGWFPGPVLYGMVVDSSCKVWNSGCGNDGSCALYDIELFRYRRNILPLSLYFLMTFLYFVIYILSKKKVDWSITDTFVPDMDTSISSEGEGLMNGKDTGNGDISVSIS